jgi:molybdopterin-guanine dinucleotide biosynthesis protein B
MQRLHIVGRKNHGKTTLVVELVAELTRRGRRVGTIKHSRHIHELDAPGTDSFRHRHAGAQAAAIVSAELVGVFFPRPPLLDVYERLEPLYAQCDLVLVEGHIDLPGTKIEVWRAGLGTASLAAERDDIAAVVSDDPLNVAVSVLPRHPIDRVVEYAESLITATREDRP